MLIAYGGLKISGYGNDDLPAEMASPFSLCRTEVVRSKISTSETPGVAITSANHPHGNSRGGRTSQVRNHNLARMLIPLRIHPWMQRASSNATPYMHPRRLSNGGGTARGREGARWVIASRREPRGRSSRQHLTILHIISARQRRSPPLAVFLLLPAPS
ncbi:hypothetical protein BV20DRAFT_573830 [Pilatotrama ljubarskyi]|nr:hypothetical protein BV20DRAFT_573830 [Pilatotrama ljubarskyi]